MKAVVQRVLDASCTVEGSVTGSIRHGLLVYLGVDRGDDEEIMEKMMGKILRLRCFEDERGKMNLSLKDTGGEVLIISQFTLSADVYHGNRPSFDSAESPDKAESLYRKAVEFIRNNGIGAAEGMFGAHMEISYTNDGPVTFFYDSSALCGTKMAE